MNYAELAQKYINYGLDLIDKEQGEYEAMLELDEFAEDQREFISKLVMEIKKDKRVSKVEFYSINLISIRYKK